MTIKELIAIASHPEVMCLMRAIEDSAKNDVNRTEIELKSAIKERQMLAKQIKGAIAKQ